MITASKTYPALLTKKTSVLPSLCGADQRLCIKGAFSLLVDAAADHSEQIGTGCRDMRSRHRFWLMSRAKIRFYSRPEMMDEITVTTWPKTPGHFLCDRFYTVEKDGACVLEGRQEWAVLDTDTGRPVRTEDIYPEGLSPLPAAVLPTPFSRLRDTLVGEDLVSSLRVNASDIDFGGHVNNIVYLRMLTDSFTTAEYLALSPREVEVQYLCPCFEGENLSVLRKRTDEGYLFSIRKESGKTAFLARIAV